LIKDMHGIVEACNSKRAYTLIFNLIFPEYFPVFHKVCEYLFDSSQVMCALLGFFAEFVFSKGGRISFDISSVNGILLFREASKLLVSYGSTVLKSTSPRDLWKDKYKGMSLCFSILNRTIVGNYVNFGVFGLYGDPALNNALEVSLKMALSIPPHDIMSLPKLCRAYYLIFETLCSNNMSTIARLEPQPFGQLLLAIKEGLESVESTIVSQCCTIVDKLISYHFATAKEVDQTAQAILNRHLIENSDSFAQMLNILFRKSLDNCNNLWSVGKPILSLAVLNPEYFQAMKTQLIARQPLDKQPQLIKDFDDLMSEVKSNLEMANRDKFSQNFNTFVQDAKKYIISL